MNSVLSLMTFNIILSKFQATDLFDYYFLSQIIKLNFNEKDKLN
jgi:hypothetical protein